MRPQQLVFNASMMMLFALHALGFGQVDRTKFQIREDISASKGGPPSYDDARAVVIAGDNAIVAGTVLRAYDKASGELRWEDGVNSELLATSSGTVFAQITNGPIRAYDAATGRALWETAIVGGVAIAANDNAVVSAAGFVNAYDPVDGRLLWQILSPGGSEAFSVALDGFNVFVAGRRGTGSQRDMVLSSYDARSGTFRWESTRRGVSPSAIVAENQRVYVSGNTVPDIQAYVAAFETGSGDLLWQDISNSGAYADIAVKRNTLVLAGHTEAYGLAVRAYDVNSGQVVWYDTTEPSAGTFEFLRAVVVSDDAVYVAGQRSSGGSVQPVLESLVRSYELARGVIIYQETFDASPDSLIFDAAVDSGIFIVAGHVLAPNGTYDRSIKAYSFTDVESSRLGPTSFVGRLPEQVGPRERVRR